MLRAMPDPMIYPVCQWCGGGECLGILTNGRDNLNHITCWRCYETMFRDYGRRPIF